MICSICLDRLEVFEKRCIKTTCSHFFHYDCMFTWFSIRHECPSCRRPLGPHDCVSLEKSCLMSENGITINRYTFYPKTLREWNLVLLYLFFLQHAVLLSEISLTVEMMLSRILQNFVERICQDRQVEWTHVYPEFHRDKDFFLHVKVEDDTVHDNKKVCIHMDDIRYLFHPNTSGTFLLM